MLSNIGILAFAGKQVIKQITKDLQHEHLSLGTERLKYMINYLSVFSPRSFIFIIHTKRKNLCFRNLIATFIFLLLPCMAKPHSYKFPFYYELLGLKRFL